MNRGWLAAAAVALVAVGWACGEGDEAVRPTPNPPVISGGGNGPPGGGSTGDAGTAPDAGTADAGGKADAGTPAPDAGQPDAGEEDAGTDAGGDAGATPTAGPWPTTPVVNYSARYGLGSIQSVGVDDAYNIWLLNGARIGVLRPGTTSPVWVSGIGQASQGFSREALAMNSTVICGGAAGQAYVGYWTYEYADTSERLSPEDPEFKKGDLDVVQLDPQGNITLLEHLHRSAGSSQPWPKLNIGIRNTNDWHFDEDRTVLTCQRVMKGPFKGELYIGTNHGVTRIRGLEYNSHRHPIWMNGQTHMIGYSYGLGIGQNGDVLIANEWNVGMIAPSADLTRFDKDHEEPWLLNTHNQELNSLEEMDYWRAFQQTTDGQYYLGSKDYGLWRMERTPWAVANWFKVSGLPTQNITALAATDDGSLFIGTDGSGLWRMDAQKRFSRFDPVSGSRVKQLVYDPTVSPAMLYALTSDGLYVIRGH